MTKIETERVINDELLNQYSPSLKDRLLAFSYTLDSVTRLKLAQNAYISTTDVWVRWVSLWMSLT